MTIVTVAFHKIVNAPKNGERRQNVGCDERQGSARVHSKVIK